jgi:hypothetical protein
MVIRAVFREEGFPELVTARFIKGRNTGIKLKGVNQ